MDTIWKTVPDFPNYEVNERGRIRNIKTECTLQPRDDGRGYKRVTLYRDRKKCEKYVHLVVASAYFGDTGDKEIVHLDGNAGNNSVENLSAMTHSQAIRYSNKCGFSHTRHSKKEAAYLEKQDEWKHIFG